MPRRDAREGSAWARTPERWAPVLGLLLLIGGYAALGRGVKAGVLLLVAAGVAGIGVLRRAPAPPGGSKERVARWLPAIIPLLLAFVIDLQPRIVEVVMSDPDRRWRATMALLAVGLTALVLIMVGVDVRALVVKGVRAVTSALRIVVSYVIYVLVLLPVGVAHLWRRADPLGTGGKQTGTAWHQAIPAHPDLGDRTFRSERPY